MMSDATKIVTNSPIVVHRTLNGFLVKRPDSAFQSSWPAPEEFYVFSDLADLTDWLAKQYPPDKPQVSA
jgi:hypothetical protein